MPNIALMRIAAHHRTAGDDVTLQHVRRPDSVERTMFDTWDRVYASAIFTKTQPVVQRLKASFPDAIVGGTGVDLGKPEQERASLEQIGVLTKKQDYSDYPGCRTSIGFTQRGCRMRCHFCDVPKKEPRLQAYATIREIWRGEPWPRELILLDNDFFGPDNWPYLVDEIRDGDFKVCFTQGINARMLSDEAAKALASMKCCDDSFKRRRIYTAWDNIGDEGPLFRGLNALVRHGFKPDQIMVYILVGDSDTEEDRLYRQSRLREFGCRPYPMPYVRTPELVGFQRWVIGAYDKRIPWAAWKANGYRPERLRERQVMA